MGNPNLRLDPETQAKLIEFVKHSLGLFGALKFQSESAKCPCYPCQTFRAMIAGAKPEQPS
jgi:hypothetical protein